MKLYYILLCIILILASGCSQSYEIIDRESKIPQDVLKVTPEADINPPKSYSDEYNNPVSVSDIINTAGAEDSPFILPDGNTLYFFFTPDVKIPVEKQVIDKVTGIYVSKKVNDKWQKAERIFLQKPNKAGSDGCEFVQNNLMYFCSVREGYSGIHWFSAEYKNDKWTDWKLADDVLKTQEYQTGELHISSDNQELYFHADNKAGGKGSRDIWVSKRINNKWSVPENVEIVNTERDDGYPALNPEGDELWFTRDYGVWRSKRIDNEWQEPKLMFSPLAGEPSIDNEGNVYFVHHFFKDNKMIEADIYVAYKK